MTSRQQFIRKIIYLVIMAVLLGVLAYLGTPAAPSRDPQKASPGGVLAQVREIEAIAPEERAVVPVQHPVQTAQHRPFETLEDGLSRWRRGHAYRAACPVRGRSASPCG